MTDHAEMRTRPDNRPHWFSVILSTVWILMSWQVHEFLVGIYFMLQIVGTTARQLTPPSGSEVCQLAPAQMPESDFFVQFFGPHVLVTTIAIAAVILGKDLVLSPPRARRWNIALAILCGVLLFWGRLSLAIMEGSWGIVH